MAYVGATSYGLGCKQCPPGTYVKPEIAPATSQTDCQSCPIGTNRRGILMLFNFIKFHVDLYFIHLMYNEGFFQKKIMEITFTLSEILT